MDNKISVITVVYNDVANIRATMESYFSQTWDNKEYIVIDGGSTDGTADIIREYSDRLAFWCSEKDEGMYDAMNKGIEHSSGDWINILNSGDLYVEKTSLENVIKSIDTNNTDVIYGNSIEIDNIFRKQIIASENTNNLEYYPIYRHGASLIRAEIQKSNKFDLTKQKQLGYSLDWNMIFNVYKAGYTFKKVDVYIEAYKKDGTSNHPIKNLWYNYLITSSMKFNMKKFIFMLKMIIFTYFKNSRLYTWIKAFLFEVIANDLLSITPFWTIRKAYLKIIGLGIGKGSFIMKKNYFINPNLVIIGEYTHINRGGIIDGRGGITIGNNVSISHNVNIMTGSHSINSETFQGIFKPITIKDFVWIGIGATILQGVTIGEGAVICAGAVVINDVEAFSVVGGIPAKKIKERNRILKYKCDWNVPFT